MLAPEADLLTGPRAADASSTAARTGPEAAGPAFRVRGHMKREAEKTQTGNSETRRAPRCEGTEPVRGTADCRGASAGQSPS